MIYLEDWAILDRVYSGSLSGATEALRASSLRLPVIGGAKVFSFQLQLLWFVSDCNLIVITYYYYIFQINIKPLYFATGRSVEFEGRYLFSNGCDAGHGVLHMPIVTEGTYSFWPCRLNTCWISVIFATKSWYISVVYFLFTFKSLRFSQPRQGRL